MSAPSEKAAIQGYYEVVCRDKTGAIKWQDSIKNLVTTAGKNLTLNTMLGNTAAGIVSMGLKGPGTPTASDTQASHGSWAELTNYVGNRVVPTFNAAALASKTTQTAAAFTMIGNGTVIAGCFINVGGLVLKGDGTPTLFSVGDFSGGAKTANDGDVLSVTYTATLT